MRLGYHPIARGISFQKKKEILTALPVMTAKILKFSEPRRMSLVGCGMRHYLTAVGERESGELLCRLFLATGDLGTPPAYL
jgi:hypothetical protein